MNKGRVAFADDEENLRETVLYALRKEGYEAVGYADGLAAWEGMQAAPADLVILDILMPRMDGLELCRRLRAGSESLPILFLSSRDEELDRVLGLELGADDYLCKPFSMRELIARVRVLFRRLALGRAKDEPGAAKPEEKLLACGQLCLDLQRYQVTWRGSPVQLTLTEFLILQALVRHPGHVKSRQNLLDEGYAFDTYVSDRTIDSHIKRLRRKMVEADSSFDEIETVYGLGYRWRQG
jgi:two-component system, OmpR family, response regulator ChvI